MFTVRGICVFVFFINVVKTEISIVKIAEQFMYQVEKHEAATEDGYQLSVYRIPAREPRPEKPPVLLMHGLFSSGVDYLVLGPGRALGFLLSAAGYDVWLGSLRGIPESTGHVDKTINDADYWDFSLDEVSKYDLPAIVELVLTSTGQRSVSYIGHSMGNTLIMMMLAELPKYAGKINVAILLGPVVFITNPDPLLMAAQQAIPIVQQLLSYAKIFNVPTDNEELRRIAETVVSTPKGLAFLRRMLDFVFGAHCHLNEFVLKGLFNHAPTPASTRLLQHYSQIIGSESLPKYNWGRTGNLKAYNSEEPPDYDLSKITTRVYLFRGNTDVYTSKEDVDKLQAVLPGATTFLVQAKQFGHMSFVYSDIADELVYRHILHILQNKTPPSETPDICGLRGVWKLPYVWELSDTCGMLNSC